MVNRLSILGLLLKRRKTGKSFEILNVRDSGMSRYKNCMLYSTDRGLRFQNSRKTLLTPYVNKNNSFNDVIITPILPLSQAPEKLLTGLSTILPTAFLIF